MKLTDEQDRLLRRYLNNAMQYRETQQEVYDHIVTGINNCNVQAEDFGGAVTRIVQDDFGGQAKLAKLERVAQWSVTKRMIRKQLGLIGGYFWGTALLATIICIGLVYALLLKTGINGWLFEGITSLAVFTPFTLCLVRYYQLGYRLKETKPSVRDMVFRWMAATPPRLFIMGNLFFAGVGHAVWQGLNVYIATALIIIATVYALAFVKLCKEDIDVKIIA